MSYERWNWKLFIAWDEGSAGIARREKYEYLAYDGKWYPGTAYWNVLYIRWKTFQGYTPKIQIKRTYPFKFLEYRKLKK